MTAVTSTADKEAFRSLSLQLQLQANRIRQEIVRMIHQAQSGHPGGALSAADIVTALYFHFMRIRPTQPQWPDRDRFILSKGHAAPVLYAALALREYFSLDELPKLRQVGSILQGHPDVRKTPGVDFTSGSLGQGLGVASGMAIGLKRRGSPARVYVMLGDGEMQEGSVWESLRTAVRFSLDNLVAIIDVNGLQCEMPTVHVPGSPPSDLKGSLAQTDELAAQRRTAAKLKAKLEAFGWTVTTFHGNDMDEVLSALGQALEKPSGTPTALVALTIKGKGVSFMSNRAAWHGRAPSDDELRMALSELEEEREKLLAIKPGESVTALQMPGATTVITKTRGSSG